LNSRMVMKSWIDRTCRRDSKDKRGEDLLGRETVPPRATLPAGRRSGDASRLSAIAPCRRFGAGAERERR
jgi:hypothetical protein